MLRDGALAARRFPFPMPGRRKPVVEAPPLPEPTSKAHRILGSTPLSIDVPPPIWDDGCSSVTSDDRSATTATSYLGPHSDAGDLDDGHRVGIAKSDSGWGDDADPVASPLRLDDDSDAACSAALRKSRSSSTLRSWYDKSKLPLSISQQTSSSAMAKGPPTKDGRKKPARLDLSSLVPGCRAARKASLPAVLPDAARGEPLLGPEFMMKSPSILSSAAPLSAAQRGPPATGPWPPTNAALSALPTLYDSYEQMCIRRIMSQCSQPESEPVAPQQPQPPPCQPQPQLQPPPPPPQQPQLQQPQSQQPQHHHQRRSRRQQQGRHDSECLHRQPVDKPPPPFLSGPSRHARKSRSFGSANLQQTSVLELSSDSEEDDDQDDASPPAAPASPTSAPARRPSALDDAPPLVSSRQRTSRAEKRASFAPANTYITIPSTDERGRSPGPGAAPFRRSSFMSSSSSGSSAAGPGGGGIRPMPAPRRPSNADREEQVKFDRTVFHRESLTSSVDQLTPPLSPTSVDFYMRSARSSADGPGTHSRLMAVTRQEEMLLSALRQKQRSMRRGSALAELQEGNEDEEEQQQQQQQQPPPPQPPPPEQRRGSRSSKALDLGFPAPPSFAAERSSSAERGSADRRRHTQEEVVVPFYLDDTEPRPDLSDLAGWDAEPPPRRDSSARRRNSAQAGASGSHAMLHPESFARLAGVAEEDVVGGAEEDVPRPDSPISPESFPVVPNGQPMRSTKARLSAVGSGLLGGAAHRPERPERPERA